ncbi:MAG: ATP-binding protein [Phascolarctobacterium faecium]
MCSTVFIKRGETNKSGSGLGLAISKQISERHGIGLTMTSIPGEATSVVLQLPPALKKEVQINELWL